MNSNKEKQNQLNNQSFNHQYFLKNKFTLSNLVQLMPVSKIFVLQTNQIQFSQQENFTFGTEWYTIKIPKSRDNQKRIFYYSLLCYIFQIAEGEKAQKYQEVFIKYVIEKLQIILPYRAHSDMINSMFSPLMTTNQIKTCFVKFVNIIKKRQKGSKIVLEELNTIPQIDFIFMSVFQMYLRKHEFSLQYALQRVEKDFGIKGLITDTGYWFDDECQIERKYTDDRWQRFFVKKIDTKKSIKQSTLKRKLTTQSVGEIEQDGFESREQLDKCLHYDQLINAKFVQSYQTQSIANLQKEAFNQHFSSGQLKDSINQNFSPFLRKQRVQTEGSQKSTTPSTKNKRKKTSFFQAFHYQIIKGSKENLKKQRVKTQLTNHSPAASFEFRERRVRDKSPFSRTNYRKNSQQLLIRSDQTSKSQKNLLIKQFKCSFMSSYSKNQSQKQYKGFNAFVNRFPQKRQTLQKLSFNYGFANIQTC